MKFAGLCELLDRYPLVLIPISYIIYRLSRTFFAILRALFLYRIVPIFYTPNLDKYANRWTVVSGATDGIGKAYVRELARRGVRKFFLIGRNEEKLDAVRNEIEKTFEYSTVRTFLLDFNSDDFERLRSEVADLNIGLAVNSVGVGRQYLERFGDRPEADSQILRVNALGAAEFISAVLPPMEQSGGGQIVVLSSSQGVRPIPLLAAYSASKSLMSFISEAVDREYTNINVQCLTPALVATNMTYYKDGSLFVVTPEVFAKEAVSVLGLVHRTSGCFNHEIQMLMLHLLPWTILKYLIMPIYYVHQKRMIKIHGTYAACEKDTINESGVSTQNSSEDGSPNSSSKRFSRIPTSNGTIRSRA